MANDWFQFRNFMIRQDRSAMKVGTDGVLLGAWVDCSTCKLILDVGTGTGLLALMVAQREPDAKIVALEIDGEAFIQACENVEKSEWSDRIEVRRADFRDWQPEGDQRFDLIICNPPYFSQSLKNPDAQRAIARHDDELPLSSLIPDAASRMMACGRFSMILPVGRLQEALSVAGESGLFLTRITEVRGTEKSPVKRVLLEWRQEPLPTERATLVVETGSRGVYTEEYRKLTENFYL